MRLNLDMHNEEMKLTFHECIQKVIYKTFAWIIFQKIVFQEHLHSFFGFIDSVRRTLVTGNVSWNESIRSSIF
jgi:hypothetical protein